MIRVLVVDDHELVRRGTVDALAEHADMEVLPPAAGVADALAIASRFAPDVALVDVRLEDGDGLDLARALMELRPPPRVVLMTGHSYREHVRTALRMGIRGYVLKSAPIREMIEAIRAVASGRRAVSALVASALIDEFEADLVGVPSSHGRVTLTARQREVAGLLTKGLSNREIASQLAIGEKTVEQHVEAIIRRLGVRNRTEAAVAFATGATSMESNEMPR